jgi:protein TonB
VISIGIHAALIFVIGVFLGVGPAKTMRLVEMAVTEVARAVSEPAPAPPPPSATPSGPVRARRTRATPPTPAAPTPAVDTGPSAPGAPDTAMPAAAGPAVPDGDPNGVLGGSTAPNAVAPGAAGGPPAPPPERRIYDMGDLDAPPSVVGNCSAEVPAFARQTNQSGWVMLQFTLDADGRVSSPRVRASSPAGVFDQAALDAIRRCRYTAPRVGGRAVSVTFRQRLRFEP